MWEPAESKETMKAALEDDLERVAPAYDDECLSRSLSHYLGAGATARYPDSELVLDSVPDWQSLAATDYDMFPVLEERRRRGLLTQAERQRLGMLDAWTRGGPPPNAAEDTFLVQLRTEEGDELLEVRPTDAVHVSVRRHLGLRGRRRKNATLSLTHAGEQIEDDGMSFADFGIDDGGTINILNLGPAPPTREQLCKRFSVKDIDEKSFKVGRTALLLFASKMGNNLCYSSCSQPCAQHILDLVEAGADVNAQDRLGNTALHYVVWAPLRAKWAITNEMTAPALVQRLLDAGAQPDLENHEGLTPLQVFRHLLCDARYRRYRGHDADAESEMVGLLEGR